MPGGADVQLGWSTLLALIGTAVGLALTATIILAPIGIPVILMSCRPLSKKYGNHVRKEAYQHTMLKNLGPDLYPWEEPTDYNPN